MDTDILGGLEVGTLSRCPCFCCSESDGLVAQERFASWTDILKSIDAKRPSWVISNVFRGCVILCIPYLSCRPA
jgi:hypothetical protein